MSSAKWLIFVSLLMGFLFASCEQMTNWLEGQMEEPFSIARYDRLQNELGVTGNFSTMQRMNTEFPRQTQILIEDVLEIGSVTDPDIKDKLSDCLGDTAMLLLMADGEQLFGDMTALNRQFEKAVKRMAKEFPSLPTPRVYAQFSGLNESVVVSDSLLGFSIDKYMGVDYPLYKRYFYDHQIATMGQDRIVTDCIFFYLRNNYPLPSTAAGTLLENMVHLGKLNWITQKLIENERMEHTLGYTEQDMQWIKANRQQILDYVMTFQSSTDPQVLRNLLNATSTATINGQQVPAMLGVWVGYQMVNQYMKRHKISMQELATADNIATIVSAFNYKID